MINNLLPFLILLAIAWAWLDGARAREMATALVRRYCDNRDLQLLDDTVALTRMGLRWTGGGLRIRRMFRFDFSLEGVGRRTGYILMLGMKLESVDDGLPPEDSTGEAAPQPQAANAEGGKVIPFRRRDH